MLYSSENRAAWKNTISRVFRVEISHNKYADMRAGSCFKVPKITPLSFTERSAACEDCKKDAGSLKEAKKSTRNERILKRIWQG